MATVFLLLLGVIYSAYGQSGRFEQQKRTGLAYVKSGKFDEAAARLEEVWDIDKSDPLVGESLALAYLNGSDRRTNPQYAAIAYQIMEKSVSDGGRAVFLVKHSHEKLGLLRGGAITNFCAGQLIVQHQRIAYVGEIGKEATDHSWDLPPDAVLEAAPDPNHESGSFRLKTKDKTYGFVLRSADANDATFLIKLLHENVKSPGQ